MTLEEMVNRKNQLQDDLISEIDSRLKRFLDATGLSVASIDIELMDITSLGEQQPRRRVVSAVNLRVDF